MDRREFLKGSTAVAAGVAVSLSDAGRAIAQSRAESLRAIGAGSPNTLDPQSPTGIGRPAQAMLENSTDRLVRFGTKVADNGVAHYDYYTLEGELAESWEWSADGTSITFKIRQDATFHDGAPATAQDAKWSLDRAVTAPSTRGQMKAGSLTSPEQFVVIDDHTFRIDLPQRDNRTLRDLCHPYAGITNSRLAKRHATKDDPWAHEWMKGNHAGGGAFKLESFKPGEQVVYVRNDAWTCGPLPAFRRVIYQVVPEATNRRALIEKGSADIALDLPPKDARDLTEAGKLKMLSLPAINGFEFVGMTNSLKPFDDIKVRQAVAYALPYQQMFQAAVFGRGRPLYGGPKTQPTTIDWPAPFPYDTDLDRAKALLAEAGHPNGFETTFSYDQGQADIGEPVAILLQETLAKAGIKVKIEKWPSGQMGSALQKHEIPFYYQRSSAWLNDPVYAFQIFYQGDWRWNLGHFKNAELDDLATKARFETDEAKYQAMCIRLKEIAFEHVPIMMLWQPLHDVAAQQDIDGYRYMPHRNLDLRTLRRA
jgi:peptide/nickel transport system substrate-binding protein